LFTSGPYKSGEWEEGGDGNRGHEVILRGRLADVAQRFLKAGSRVLVVGKLYTSDWLAQLSYTSTNTTEVIAHELFILGDEHRPDSSQAAASAAPDPVDDGPF
jgi:single-strand DNA-binding protein